MRLVAVLLLTLVLTPAACAARQGDRLEGCVAPRTIAAVLGEMRPENPRPLSAERRRAALAEAAKLFAQAAGVGAADLKTVGAEARQDYRWEKFKGEERRLYTIDLGFAREAGLWK